MTEFNFLADFVDVGILATCLGFGYILEHWIGRVPNWLTPTLLGVIGVGLSFWVSQEFTHEALGEEEESVAEGACVGDAAENTETGEEENAC